MTVLVIDHSGYGPDEAKLNIENEKYTNPHVMSVEEADIGEWTDEHPLNNTKKQAAEFKRLFPEQEIPEGQWCRNGSEQDKPHDWLFCSLVFAKALSKLLKETEGVVIIPENDIMKLSPDQDAKSFVVHRSNGQIRIQSYQNRHFPDGQMVWQHEDDENPHSHPEYPENAEEN